ncbi:hypothetical protein BV898_05241 [Hypsibius exemplaris]|uniref:Ataxin-2 C-terminal domain-containing protein n=1 Tax=Hypsibius exemplaris TaxID=2072580 RepID=A0A1W0X0A9_HYPEX|nr:hypothetical protein BV898_05241 [Hypsibius exemplaris]
MVQLRNHQRNKNNTNNNGIMSASEKGKKAFSTGDSQPLKPSHLSSQGKKIARKEVSEAREGEIEVRMNAEHSGNGILISEQFAYELTRAVGFPAILETINGVKLQGVLHSFGPKGEVILYKGMISEGPAEVLEDGSGECKFVCVDKRDVVNLSVSSVPKEGVTLGKMTPSSTNNTTHNQHSVALGDPKSVEVVAGKVPSGEAEDIFEDVLQLEDVTVSYSATAVEAAALETRALPDSTHQRQNGSRPRQPIHPPRRQQPPTKWPDHYGDRFNDSIRRYRDQDIHGTSVSSCAHEEPRPGRHSHLRRNSPPSCSIRPEISHQTQQQWQQHYRGGRNGPSSAGYRFLHPTNTKPNLTAPVAFRPPASFLGLNKFPERVSGPPSAHAPASPNDAPSSEPLLLQTRLDEARTLPKIEKEDKCEDQVVPVSREDGGNSQQPQEVGNPWTSENVWHRRHLLPPQALEQQQGVTAGAKEESGKVVPEQSDASGSRILSNLGLSVERPVYLREDSDNRKSVNSFRASATPLNPEAPEFQPRALPDRQVPQHQTLESQCSPSNHFLPQEHGHRQELQLQQFYPPHFYPLDVQQQQQVSSSPLNQANLVPVSGMFMPLEVAPGQMQHLFPHHAHPPAFFHTMPQAGGEAPGIYVPLLPPIESYYASMIYYQLQEARMRAQAQQGSDPNNNQHHYYQKGMPIVNDEEHEPFDPPVGQLSPPPVVAVARDKQHNNTNPPMDEKNFPPLSAAVSYHHR